jgi:SPP1 family predicted phage head-tail adaptor
MSFGAKAKHRVMLQSPATGRDAYGQPLDGWTDVVSVRAIVADVSGREYMAAGATQNAAVTKITVRKRSGVEPAMRVLHGEVAYNIEAVLDQDNGMLLLMCSRGANNG